MIKAKKSVAIGILREVCYACLLIGFGLAVAMLAVV